MTTDPNDKSSEEAQTQQSVVLPPLEPRSYAAEDKVTVTFEGSYAGNRTAGFLHDDGTLTDASFSFCRAGVYDVATMKGYAQSELGVADDAAELFAQSHGDYVQLTTALLSETDSYWKSLAASDSAKAKPSHAECLALFGANDDDPLLPRRDFRIVQASAGKLLLVP